MNCAAVCTPCCTRLPPLGPCGRWTLAAGALPTTSSHPTATPVSSSSRASATLPSSSMATSPSSMISSCWWRARPSAFAHRRAWVIRTSALMQSACARNRRLPRMSWISLGPSHEREQPTTFTAHTRARAHAHAALVLTAPPMSMTLSAVGLCAQQLDCRQAAHQGVDCSRRLGVSARASLPWV